MLNKMIDDDVSVFTENVAVETFRMITLTVCTLCSTPNLLFSAAST